MGQYLTSAEVVTRLGTKRAYELTTETGTTPDTDIIDDVIDEAEGEANSYFARRYATPVDVSAHADAVAALKGKIIKLVIYGLEARRERPSEATISDRKDAIDWLTKVANGTILLPTATTPAATTADKPIAKHGNYRDDAGHEDML